MSKHTPGPWEIEGTPRRGWDIFSLGEERRYITSTLCGNELSTTNVTLA